MAENNSPNICQILLAGRILMNDEGNTRNEIWHWTNDEIGVAVQIWFWVRVELMAW